MLDEEAIAATLGASDALEGQLQTRIEAPFHVSRLFIWLMKLRICWSILRTPVRFEEGDETTPKE